jgi:PhnB protein
MSLSLSLSFNGTCREAFGVYAGLLGGTITFMATYAESPMAGQVSAAMQSRIMHATLRADDMTLMGSDVPPDDYQPPQGFGIVLGLSDPAEAARLFAAFADGGSIVLPLEPTFWAAAFGVVQDRWGVTWQINCESAAPRPGR